MDVNGTRDRRVDELDLLAELGGCFTLAESGGKRPLHKDWPNLHRGLDEVRQHVRNGGNVGLLTGAPSNGIVALDIDSNFEQCISKLGDYAHTLRVERSNAANRGKLLYRVDGELPPNAVWKPNGSQPEAELLSTKKHAVVPPSVYAGGHYLLKGQAHGLLSVTSEEMAGVWWSLTGQGLYGSNHLAATKQPEFHKDDDRSLFESVKEAWPTLRIFEHFGRDAHGVREEGDETRLVRNGGLLVNRNGLWYCFSTGVGGDWIDAWSFCTTGDRWNRDDKRGFWRILTHMATEAGITVPTLSSERLALGLDERIIIVNNRQLRDVLTDTGDALARYNGETPREPAVLVYGDVLARLHGHRVDILGKDSLNGILALAANWANVKTTKDGPQIVNVFPPKPVIETFLAAPDWPDLPTLKGIVRAPVYIRGGVLHDSPGYDPNTGLYLADSITLGDTMPTSERVEWAKKVILEDLLGDFPFKDEASRAHAVGLTLIGFLRHLIDGPTPLHLVDAPAPGTGKGLLVTACCLPALGEIVSSTPSAGNAEDEWRKRIMALLAGGSPYINIDNITGELDSPSLAVALTQSAWEDRVLGLGITRRIPITAIWAATANNCRPSVDIARRCVWIRLDANCERPESRAEFRHPDLIKWAQENRGELVTAAHVLLRKWIEDGMPEGKYTKGSYRAWASTIGGILDSVDINGFLGNDKAFRDSAVDEMQLWRAFIEAWAAKYSDRRVKQSELFALASHYDDSHQEQGEDLLGALLGDRTQRGRETRLGRVLREMADRVVAGWKIIGPKTIRGVKHWQLEAARSA